MDPELKTALTGIRESVGAFEPRLAALQLQVDAIDARGQGVRVPGNPPKSTADVLGENESVKRLLTDRRGRAVFRLTGADVSEFFQRKAVLASGQGFGTSGVMSIDRLPGITAEPRQLPTVRDLLSARPTAAGMVDFLRVTTPMGPASPQVEGEAKFENALGLISVSERVKTIATWLPASKQVLDDLKELAAFIDSSLRHAVNQAEELQLLSGDGLAENLHGLIPQATPFDASLLSAGSGWNRIDIVGLALQQLAVARELDPTFVVVSPTDWYSMRLLKDGFGRYILGDPQSEVPPSLFGKQVVPTTAITPGTFLVGSGSPMATEIRDRLELTVEISTEHSDFFTRNLVAVLAEKRLALITRRPGSFVAGSFDVSPS